MGGEAFDDFLFEGTDHYHVHHARNHFRRIFHRLAAAQLGVAGVQVDCRTAQLVHAGLEGEAGAGRILLEDHGQGAIGQRMVGLVALEAVLDDAGTDKQMFQLVARQILELQEML